jgi:tetratricopeptide (TPR) repeat protein
MDKGHNVSLSNDQENANEIDKDVIEDVCLSRVTNEEMININKNYLDDLEPVFKNTIENFVQSLNGHLNDVQISKDQKKLLEKRIEGLALEIKNIPSYKKIQNDILSNHAPSISISNDGSTESYDEDIEIDSMDADAYIDKGLSLYYLGNNDEAIECYDKAIEINPQNADAYYKKGLSLSTIEKYAEAIECYDKALEINPQNADAYYNKAQALSNKVK